MKYMSYTTLHVVVTSLEEALPPMDRCVYREQTYPLSPLNLSVRPCGSFVDFIRRAICQVQLVLLANHRSGIW